LPCIFWKGFWYMYCSSFVVYLHYLVKKKKKCEIFFITYFALVVKFLQYTCQKYIAHKFVKYHLSWSADRLKYFKNANTGTYNLGTTQQKIISNTYGLLHKWEMFAALSQWCNMLILSLSFSSCYGLLHLPNQNTGSWWMWPVDGILTLRLGYIQGSMLALNSLLCIFCTRYLHLSFLTSINI
jgi:hypothetical protein